MPDHRARTVLLRHSLATVLAWWTRGPRWRIRLVRLVYPDLGRRLDELTNAAGEYLGMPL